MKQIIFGMVSMALIVAVVFGVVIIGGKEKKENELEQTLDIAIHETMENLCETGDYTISDEEEFVADFCQALLGKMQLSEEMNKDKKFQLEVKVLGVDVEKGLLSVKVNERFSYPNGKEGLISKEATAVMDAEVEKPMYTVSYWKGNQLLQQFGLEAGELVVMPSKSIVDDKGRKCSYWKDLATGKRADLPKKIDKDYNFEAVFE